MGSHEGHLQLELSHMKLCTQHHHWLFSLRLLLLHSTQRERVFLQTGYQPRDRKKEKENKAIRRSRWDTVIVNNGPEI